MQRAVWPRSLKKNCPSWRGGGPAQTAAAPANTQTRQVAYSAPLLCCYHLSPSANSFKQNKRSLLMRSGCSMERILLSQRQGVCNKDCGKCVFQQQEIHNVSSVGVRMFKFSSRLCGRAGIHTCGQLATVSPQWALIPLQSFFLIGESHWGGTQLEPQRATELPCAPGAHATPLWQLHSLHTVYFSLQRLSIGSIDRK